MEISTILDEREKTHGDYTNNCVVSQKLKQAMADAVGYNKLSMVQKETLDRIATKIGRILCNPNVKDHWTDVQGYAKLAGDLVK